MASGGDNHCSEDVQMGLLRSAEGGVAQSYRGREGNDESGLRRDRADLLPLNERRGRRIRTYFRDQLDSCVANVDLLRCWKLPCCLQPKDTNWLFDACFLRN